MSNQCVDLAEDRTVALPKSHTALLFRAIPGFVTSREDLAGALVIFAVAVCHREQMSHVEDRHMFVSLWAAVVLGFAGCALAAVSDGFGFSVRTTPDAVVVQALPNLFCLTAICLFAYHGTYRATILLFPSTDRLPWIVAGVVASIEVAINIIGLIFFQISVTESSGQTVDPTVQTLSIVSIVYLCTVDTCFFIATQVRMLSLLRKGRTFQLGTSHYVESFLRCICYSGSVFTFYVTASGLTGDIFKAWSLLFTAISMMCIVLLTDADRVRKVLALLQAARKPATILESKEFEHSRQQ
ncbi:hypothetical protein DFJ73DRAFT_579822 [Zopfochytrium polystomum]|nr:hypothetical protein DFJ73DRAFT_579822 [Zopfochytrium polystomum]